LEFNQQVKLKSGFISYYLNIIKECDAIVVANFDQENKPSYIGSNTFLEMACAFALSKKIFILQDLPEQDNKLEIAGMMPISINNDLAMISKA
jgi:hypothetical protein